MKIESSAVVMQSETQQFTQISSYTRYRKLDKDEQAQLLKERKEAAEERQKSFIQNNTKDKLSISNEGRVAGMKSQYKDAYKDLQISIVRRMLELLTGKRFGNSDSLQKFQERLDSLESNISMSFTQSSFSSVSMSGVMMQSSGLSYEDTMVFERVTEVYQSQSVSFNTRAYVKTSDGEEIAIDVSFNMSSEFYAKNSEKMQRLCDPLVVNFAAPAAALESTKFSFDIDSDGTEDQISQLAKGSGFLALDKNGDGKINDGSELFGTKSGDGFADLAAYDKDKNGWIDENDEIFNKLRIWYKDDEGNDKLASLGEMGIGAIFLGNVATSYNQYGSSELNGVTRSTGIFLREEGTAGTIQHVDFAV